MRIPTPNPPRSGPFGPPGYAQPPHIANGPFGPPNSGLVAQPYDGGNPPQRGPFAPPGRGPVAVGNPPRSGPGRRGDLINRLFQQYASGGGTPFQNNTIPSRSAMTLMTQDANLPLALRVLANQSQQGDASGAPGQEVALAHTANMPLPQSIALPLPGAAAGAPLPPSTGMLNAADHAPMSAPSGPAPSTGLPTDAVHLGGGVFWSPTQGLVNNSNTQNSLGGAASGLGSGSAY